MGCAGSRDREKPEERGIVFQEHNLNHGNFDVTQMDLTMRKFAKNHFLSIEHLKVVASNLGLNLGAYKAAEFSMASIEDQKIVEFYEQLKVAVPNGSTGETTLQFDQYRLIILGVFMAKGKPKDKAQILFENFDRDLKSKLTKAEFLQLWEDVYSVVVDTSFYLARGTTPGFVNPNQLRSYLENLSQGKKIAYDEFVNSIFMGEELEEISKDQFINRMQSLLVPDMFTSTGFRTYLYQKFLTFPDDTTS